MADSPAEKLALILSAIASIQSGTANHAKDPCPVCGALLVELRGRQSGKLMLRHEPGGCSPSGQWLSPETLKPLELNKTETTPIETES